MRHVIAGTAGHIDHGKSALVKALTGTDPDRLKEEKARGITIDLGFAHLELDGVQVAFVDVPGHERFVKNMLAGVGGIDLVLLVIAADESVMPQTREHFDICRLLGIGSGIVVVTKADLVEPEMLELVREEIRDMVRGSFLEGGPVVAVSSRTGEGIDLLRQAILEAAGKIPERPRDRLLRLPIDRAFTMRGFGTVITGTLLSGEVRREEDVEILPGGLTARVRGIQVHGSPTDCAVAGQRTAVNLQGVILDDVGRGMTLTVRGRFRPSHLADVRLSLLPSAQPLRNLRKVRFHHGTAEVLARVALLGRDSLAPGETCYAQLRLDAPVFCLLGDRFIIRRFSPAFTIGGGCVLNPHPAKHKSTDAGVASSLERLDRGTLEEKAAVLVATHEMRIMDARELNASLGLRDDMLRDVQLGASTRGELTAIAAPVPYLVVPGLIRALEERSLAVIGEFHDQNPLQKGISREELRKRVYDNLPAELFRHCLDSLSRSRRISLHDEAVALHGRSVQLSDGEQRLREQIEALYAAGGYQPPLLGEITAALVASPADMKRVYFWMIKAKILVKVSEDLAYLSTTLDDIKGRIRARFPPGSKFGVAEFKELFDLTRKHAIPLLEHLDRERFTRRQGNDRILL